MTLKVYDFETGPQGAVANVGNTGATVIALNGGTVIFDAASANTGEFGLKFTSSANVNGMTARFDAAATNKAMSVAVGFTAPPTPSADRNIFNINGTPDLPVFRVSVNPSNHLVFDAKTLINFIDTGVILVPGRKYRMEVILLVAASPTTTNGQIQVNVHDGNDGPALNASVISDTSFDLGTVAISGVDINIQPNMTFSVDDIRFNNGGTTFLGPAADPSTAVSTVRPTSMAANPGGFSNVGTAPNMTTALADESDATYITSPGAPTGNSVTFALAPVTAGPITINARHQASAASPVISRKYELIQGSTVVATRNVSLTSAWVNYSFTTTTAETAALSMPRNNLFVRITDTSA